jgi:hypothetical protein
MCAPFEWDLRREGTVLSRTRLVAEIKRAQGRCRCRQQITGIEVRFPQRPLGALHNPAMDLRTARKTQIPTLN